MITVACVLKTGGTYTREWVHALKRGLNRHLDGFEFVCLTDDPGLTPLWRVPLQHGWPGWWSKLELFRPGLFDGPVLYLDLDTLVVGDLAELCSYDGELAMLSDFYRPERAQSGVMMWTQCPLTHAIYEEFVDCGGPSSVRQRGDGEWLNDVAWPDRIQNLFPGQVVSYKVHAKNGPPSNARLVCAHGKPKWNDPTTGWAHHEWTRIAA